jgi:hypothetical protein
MSASTIESDWNFRLIEKRLVVVKTKSEPARKIAVIDVLSNLMFTVQVTEAIDIQKLVANIEYLFTLNVYTSKNLEEVNKDFISFFEAVDINQDIEDFIKAYGIYPTKITNPETSANAPAYSSQAIRYWRGISRI